MFIAMVAIAVFFLLFLAGFVDLAKLNKKEEEQLSQFRHDIMAKEELLRILDKSEVCIRSYQKILEAIERELPRKKFRNSYAQMVDGNYSEFGGCWEHDGDAREAMMQDIRDNG